MSNILEEVKKLLGKGAAIKLVPLGQEDQGFYWTPTPLHGGLE
jgi:hypothetical protein